MDENGNEKCNWQNPCSKITVKIMLCHLPAVVKKELQAQRKSARCGEGAVDCRGDHLTACPPCLSQGLALHSLPIYLTFRAHFLILKII